MKFQIVSKSNKALFTGTYPECLDELSDYGTKKDEFQILQYLEARELEE